MDPDYKPSSLDLVKLPSKNPSHWFKINTNVTTHPLHPTKKFQ